MNWHLIVDVACFLVAVEADIRAARWKRDGRRLRLLWRHYFGAPPVGTLVSYRDVLDNLRPAWMTRRQLLEKLLEAEERFP